MSWYYKATQKYTVSNEVTLEEQTHIQNLIFSTEYQWEKADNSYQPLDGGETETKSHMVNIRVSESDAWPAKIFIFNNIIGMKYAAYSFYQYTECL